MWWYEETGNFKALLRADVSQNPVLRTHSVITEYVTVYADDIILWEHESNVVLLGCDAM
jgi:hypothetical protein